MCANSPIPRDPPPAETGAVVTMLDRPVADVARFAVSFVATWVRGLLDPWRLGRSIASGAKGLAPPFAFLVVGLFALGVLMRLWRSLSAMPMHDVASFVADLRVALGEVSLTHVVFATLPCVLVVVGGARLMSVLNPVRRPPFSGDRLVAAACYAVGWQAGFAALLMVVAVVLQMAGFEPGGEMNDEINDAAPWLALWAVVWGVLIVAPSVQARLPQRWWATPVALTACVALSVGLLGASMGALHANTDLKSADELHDKRLYDQWIGELQVNVLETRPLEEAGSGAERFEMLVAYTNRTERLLVAPTPEVIQTPDEFTRKAGVTRLGVKLLAGAEAGDALLIEPGETRLARYEAVRLSTEPPDGKPMTMGADPFAWPYHRRDPDGQFARGEAVLWAPKPDATRVAVEGRDADVERR